MSMWFEVEITATATISVEADDKSAAEDKISSAIMMSDSELIDQDYSDYYENINILSVSSKQP